MNEKEFANYKQQVLSSVDLSRKSEIDEKILPLVAFINASDCYVTLSSCSGRAIIFSQGETNRKHDCKWVYTTHCEIDESDVKKALETSNCSSLVFKFEPFILHVGCRDRSDAKHFLNQALSCGYRNSGVVLGKTKKQYVAVRSTANLEIPLSDENGRLLVSDEYLNFIVKEANQKFRDNFCKLSKFEDSLKESLPGVTVPKLE